MKFAYHSVILSNAKDDTTFTDIEGTFSILHLISLIISYKGAVYPVTCIAAGAFYREPITSVELPSTLQEIQERSFMHTQLKSVVIPASTWRIGASSFAATPIESVRMSNGVRKIEGSAFAGCYKLTRVMLPESVSKIDRNVFRNCI